MVHTVPVVVDRVPADARQIAEPLLVPRPDGPTPRDAIGDLPGIGWNPVDDDRHRVNHWLTCITVDPETGTTPEQLRLALEGADIESRPVWKPMHLQPVFAGARAVLDGTSDRLFATGLCLPSGGAMTGTEQDRIVEIVRKHWGSS